MTERELRDFSVVDLRTFCLRMPELWIPWAHLVRRAIFFAEWHRRLIDKAGRKFFLADEEERREWLRRRDAYMVARCDLQRKAHAYHIVCDFTLGELIALAIT